LTNHRRVFQLFALVFQLFALVFQINCTALNQSAMRIFESVLLEIKQGRGIINKVNRPQIIAKSCGCAVNTVKVRCVLGISFGVKGTELYSVEFSIFSIDQTLNFL
jgi:hypothetical protein